MPCSAASACRSSPSALSAIAIPPGSGTGEPCEHVHRDVREISGPPPDREYCVAHVRECRQGCNHSAEANETGDRQDRQDRGIGPSIQTFAQGGKTPEVEDDDSQGRSRERNNNRPDAGHRPIVVPPHTSWARNEKSSRGSTTSDIRKLVHDDDDERQCRKSERAAGWRCACHAEFRPDRNRPPLSPARELSRR